MYTHVQLVQLTSCVNTSRVHKHKMDECNRIIVISVYVYTGTGCTTYILSESKSHTEIHKE